MRVIFLGTPEFAVRVLDAINNSGHEVCAVITQPDRINGRNKKTITGAVKSYAIEHGIKVFQFEKISIEGEETLRSLNPDIMVTCAYGQILKQNILDICPIINVHASLLPKYRGSSPVQWALINGEKEVGVTIMKTELGIDTGDMLLTESTVLKGDENSEEVLSVLSEIGARLIVKALDIIESGTAKWEKQDESKATHCKMLSKADGKIDFSESALRIKNFIRGMTPWPGAFTKTEKGILKILKADTAESSGGDINGEVVVSDPKKGLIVKCGEGYLDLKIIQNENGKAMDSKAYLLGHKISVGSVFGD